MADSRLQYNPNTVIPTELTGVTRYLQEELDKISFTFANLDFTTTDSEEGETPEVPEVAIHADLDQREAFNSHPMSAITGLEEILVDHAEQIFMNTRVFFGGSTPTDEESSPGDIHFVSGYD
jgi:hypothetical protein